MTFFGHWIQVIKKFYYYYYIPSWTFERTFFLELQMKAGWSEVGRSLGCHARSRQTRFANFISKFYGRLFLRNFRYCGRFYILNVTKTIEIALLGQFH